jgi:hypothetical protein
MNLPIKAAASIVFLLLAGFFAITVGVELLAFFIHFADWTYASFFRYPAWSRSRLVFL